jgi:phage terminase large subunit-like protein
MMAGRGLGKTRAGEEWIYRLASGKAGVRVALVGANIGSPAGAGEGSDA